MTQTWQHSEVPLDPDADITAIPYVSNAGPLKAIRENLPVGTYVNVVDEVLEPDTHYITGPYIKLQFWTPEWAEGAEPEEGDAWFFDGRIRIYRRMLEYDRGMWDTSTLVFETDGAEESSLSAENVVIDDVGTPRVMCYYTIYYGDSISGGWVTSTVNCMARNYALTNLDELAIDGYTTKKSPMGMELYHTLDAGLKYEDHTNGYKLLELCMSIGRALDAFVDELLFEKETRFDIVNMDANKLTYLDELLGWPTILQDDEITRRRATKNILSLWSKKGSIAGIEELAEQITGWGCTVERGYKWVLHTWSPEYLEPEDWDAEENGPWEDIVFFAPKNTTYNFSGTVLAPSIMRDDRFAILTDFSQQDGLGYGNGWKSINGLALVLYPTSPESSYLADERLQLLCSMLELMLPYHATVQIFVKSSVLLPQAPLMFEME